MRMRITLAVLAVFLCVENLAWAQTSFQEAMRKNDLQTIARLLDQGLVEDVNERGTNGKTALMIAAKSGQSRLVGKLLESGADADARNTNNGTPLMFAAINGDASIMQLILDQGVDVNVAGTNGWTALMIAAAKGHVSAARLLLEHGANVNAEDIYLWTPLHRAVYENHIVVSRLLLQQPGIEVHRRDDHGATAIHHAAANGNSRMVTLLLDHGARAQIEDNLGLTPANYAMEQGHPEVARQLAEKS